MNKTPLRAELFPRLAALNDQLCLFLLLEQELDRQLKRFGTGALDIYTTDLFSGNSYAKKIHVRLKDLPRFLTANRQFTFAAYFSTSFEVATDFFELAKIRLVEDNQIIPRRAKRCEGPEQSYERMLSAASLPPAGRETIDAITYFRYRRNAFVHLGTAPRQVFADFAKEKGAALNAAWANERKTVDFGKAVVGSLGESDAVAMIGMLRICVGRLDAHLASALNPSGVANRVAHELFSSQRVKVANTLVVERRIAKMTSYFRQFYGGSPAAPILETAARSVAAK